MVREASYVHLLTATLPQIVICHAMQTTSKFGLSRNDWALVGLASLSSLHVKVFPTSTVGPLVEIEGQPLFSQFQEKHFHPKVPDDPYTT